MTSKYDGRDGQLLGDAGDASPRRQFDRFCARVLADVSLHEKLRAPDSTDKFITVVLETARDCGFDLDGNAVRAFINGALPAATALTDDAVRETPPPPDGWLPIRVASHGDQLYVEWAYFGGERLSLPLFGDDAQRALAKPFNRLFRYVTPIAMLGGWLKEHLGLRPSGFIFHMSRCGSTLVAQMLAAVPSNVVISEAEPIDVVVGADRARAVSTDQHALWLTWIIGALGQRRTGDERHYIVKLDCWHTLALPLFRAAFPEVPWVFLYRDPVEVLVSHRRMPGSQMIPGLWGSNLFGIEPSDGVNSREDYCARVLARICGPVLGHYVDGTSLLVNYRQLPEAVWTTILPHFGIECTERDLVTMAQAAHHDAKTPSFEFTPDIETKQREATATIRHAAAERLGDIYRRLESLRLGLGQL